ncbi:hypothetical protein FIBSPDRAFT_497635 [Athelia psychrophila]|uniref:Uncharacterized protein n=1 Tax=Athelia psychrophila TaxID=1759441 RepID=A0A166KEN8_9AGAM|nr:hypothetical protein FIBSPDRAFT_497635 [Fibularhizoctonia sp. CBS 109695]
METGCNLELHVHGVESHCRGVAGLATEGEQNMIGGGKAAVEERRWEIYKVHAGRGGVQRRFVMRKHQRRKAEAAREKQNYYEKSQP